MGGEGKYVVYDLWKITVYKNKNSWVYIDKLDIYRLFLIVLNDSI